MNKDMVMVYKEQTLRYARNYDFSVQLQHPQKKHSYARKNQEFRVSWSHDSIYRDNFIEEKLDQNKSDQNFKNQSFRTYSVDIDDINNMEYFESIVDYMCKIKEELPHKDIRFVINCNMNDEFKDINIDDKTSKQLREIHVDFRFDFGKIKNEQSAKIFINNINKIRKLYKPPHISDINFEKFTRVNDLNHFDGSSLNRNILDIFGHCCIVIYNTPFEYEIPLLGRGLFIEKQYHVINYGDNYSFLYSKENTDNNKLSINLAPELIDDVKQAHDEFFKKLPEEILKMYSWSFAGKARYLTIDKQCNEIIIGLYEPGCLYASGFNTGIKLTRYAHATNIKIDQQFVDKPPKISFNQYYTDKIGVPTEVLINFYGDDKLKDGNIHLIHSFIKPFIQSIREITNIKTIILYLFDHFIYAKDDGKEYENEDFSYDDIESLEKLLAKKNK